MATLADSVIGIAQDTNKQVAGAGADALNAYHIAATAEHARQELDMEKEKQTMNKASWFASQVDAIQRQSGNPKVQSMLIDGLKKQAPQVMPGANLDSLDHLKVDPDVMQGLYQHAASFMDPSKPPTAEGAQAFMNLTQLSPPEFVNAMHDKTQANAAVLAGQAKANGFNARVDEQKNQNAVAAGDHVEKDDIIKNSKKNLNSIMKSGSILTKTNGMVTAKDLNLAYNDYMNATAPGGSATEGKVTRELPDTWTQDWNTLKQKVGQTDDLRKSPAGVKLIQELQANIANVKKDMHAQIIDQFNNIADNYKSNTNPRVQQTIETKRAAYMKAYASGNLSGVVPPDDARVNVISPDGKKGHIPASQLKEALASGYKEDK